MFALIIAIIAIALTIYLAVSTLFYGGDALSNGSARAIASAFVNQGQQVNGVHTLYKNDNAGERIDSTAELDLLVTEGYLSSIPVPAVGNQWAVADLEITPAVGEVAAVSISTLQSTSTDATKEIPAEVCDLINEQAGVGSQTFGCVKDHATLGNTVWYRM